MSKQERNEKIVDMINGKLEELGLENDLFLEPIPNTFKRRPRFGVYQDGTKRFAVQMWQLNELDDIALDREINKRINSAREHFKL
ncbi:hypothetical protein ACR6HW_16840 [Fusibacter sp. JL298sf-3]